ncbi:Peptidase U49-like protein [Vibrio crassostreae]|uniref:hypothetical protein n=1 Tax=Vibrio crassostreae TaxID=246167 RepID=UPI000F490E5C|nr:hypothetical protein [Vibrio crassostreae]ROR19793.1 hypothetical protein EDB36_101942 [Vibrio crassostreae]CAK1712264.1 Peptidase U49-like protein [Vibrio crassostreae]CAK1713347.1 Peptidase U49-like protein [Vibrio crassostreae]CAK1719359.1 Peptidase U49-like protein [Vibrio crassostreae]CAK2222877.1 Peptidase U49-like protein [Vibrio crassostreae]
MNLPPESFTAKYGSSVYLNTDEELEIGTDDYISWYLLNRASDATNLALKQLGHTSLRVSSAYLPSLKPRAFAYWSIKSPKDYVISCTRGTSETIRHILTEGDFNSLLPDDSIALSKMHVEDISALAVSLTLATILFHEVAHVTRFHLPYLVEKERAEPESLQNARGLCEVDADKWASYLIAPDLLAQAQGIHKALMLPVSIETVLREVLTLYGIALHLWFTFNNEITFRKSSIYPHPLIRSTRITVGAADNIPTESEKMEPIAIERTISILDGLNTVEKTRLRSEGAMQHPFELSQELYSINDKFSALESILNPELDDVRSRWGSPTEA